jgi:hypothetical protein
MQRAVVLVLAFVCACSARTAGEDAGVTTMVGEASTTDAQDTSSDSSGDGDGETTGVKEDLGETGDGDGDNCTEPPKLDFPPDFDNMPMPDGCTVEELTWPTSEEYPGCDLCDDECHRIYLGCAPPPLGQTCADICPSGNCLTSYWDSCEGEPFGGPDFLLEDTCGYFEIDGQCCTIAKFYICVGE